MEKCLKSVNIWQSYKQDRGCFMYFIFIFIHQAGSSISNHNNNRKLNSILWPGHHTAKRRRKLLNKPKWACALSPLVSMTVEGLWALHLSFLHIVTVHRETVRVPDPQNATVFISFRRWTSASIFPRHRSILLSVVHHNAHLEMHDATNLPISIRFNMISFTTHMA